MIMYAYDDEEKENAFLAPRVTVVAIDPNSRWTVLTAAEDEWSNEGFTHSLQCLVQLLVVETVSKRGVKSKNWINLFRTYDM